MSTSFPTFCPKITNPLWFTSGENKNDEIEICWLETKYETWLKDIIEKDKEVFYIGKKADSEVVNESEMGGEFDGSAEEEEEDINDYPDSPEEQNTNLEVGMDAGADDPDGDSWIL